MLVHIVLVHSCIPIGVHLCGNSFHSIIAAWLNASQRNQEMIFDGSGVLGSKVSNISHGREYWILRYERTLLFKFQIFHAVVRLDMAL